MSIKHSLTNDEGYQETEELLFYLIAELESVYGQAHEEMLGKAKKFLAWFIAKDRQKYNSMKKGELSKEEYQRWRMTYMTLGRNNYEMLDVLSSDLSNVNIIAASMINGYLPEVYAVNTNWAEFTIERGLKIKTSFSLFDEATVEKIIKEKPDLLPKAKIDIPLDKRWNKEKLNSAIVQGVLQGETIDEIAVRLADVTDMNKNSSVRNAATMTTAAQNAGRVDTYKRAQDIGITVRQRWIATLDGHTRSSHRKCDGEIRKIGEPFSNGLKYPGDPSGAPAEVYNCRCAISAVVDKQRFELSNRDVRELERWGDSYDEWKKEKGQSTKPMTRAARNVNRDMDMHEEYKSLLGKRVPTRFKDFQDLKYNHFDEWRSMVSAARKARNKKR